MSITVTIGSDSYIIPTNNQNPGWGEETTDWMVKVSSTLNDNAGVNDKLLTSFNIANGQSTAASIIGCVFDIATVKSIQMTYMVIRTKGTNVLTETGTLTALWNGVTWKFGVEKIGDAGMDFDILNSGQVQYFTTNMTDSGSYSGKILYRAKTIDNI